MPRVYQSASSASPTYLSECPSDEASSSVCGGVPKLKSSRSIS